MPSAHCASTSLQTYSCPLRTHLSFPRTFQPCPLFFPSETRTAPRPHHHQRYADIRFPFYCHTTTSSLLLTTLSLSTPYFPLHFFAAFAVADSDAPVNAEIIDRHVRATWPNEDTEPELYDLVKKFMTHSDCRAKRRACYVEGRRVCKKFFPKSEQGVSTFDERGYPLYRRTEKDIDIVPYNALLLLLFNGHLNVEVSTTVLVIAYVYAYIYKGPDFSSFAITDVHDNVIDTIKQWKSLR